jgi:hypothetical protein
MPSYKNKKQNKIAYSEAPSGFINIEKWEPPFAPVNNGHGFMGVVAEDSKTGQLQCHVCGKWYEILCSHFTVKHGMNGEEYRKKFGLFSGTALKSKRIRLIQSEVITRLQKEGLMNVGNRVNKNGKKYGFTPKNKHAGNRKGIKKATESVNRYGVCDLQIMTKIIELGKKLKKTPTLIDIKNEYGGGIITIMHNRYGSYVKYCRDYLKMVPNFSNHNPKFGNKKNWRTHLLGIGKEQLKKGKKLDSIRNFFPTENEPRYIYKYFKNWGDYKSKLLKFHE